MSLKKINQHKNSDVNDLIAYASQLENNKESNTIEQIVDESPMQIGHDSTTFIANRIADLSKISSKISREKSISSINQDVLYALLENSTQIGMVVREGILGYKNSQYSAKRKEFVTHDSLIVSAPKDTIIRVSLPPLIGRKFRGSYDIYWRVKIALEEYFSTHSLVQLTDEKLLLIYKKYATNLDVCFTCDNDNWESKRVTNAISEALNYSDNAAHFSMMYTAVNSPFNHVEATVIKLSDLPKFIPYLDNCTPAQPLINNK